LSATAREPKPRVAVVTFPGSNDDGDAALALAALGAEPVPVWHAERELPDVQAVVLPGGFSYGDYLRAGALAHLAPVMKPVRALAADGGLVLGICNGFQILCEAGLLPGALRANHSLSFVCRDVAVRVERTHTAFTRRCREGQSLSIPVKHGEGCFFADAELLAELEASRQVVLRYEGESPNGSIAGIAGIANAEGNVMGLMPHPEHAVDPLVGSTDGAFILGSLIEAAHESLAVPAAV
jgi:phosphoribosylformylglycinamidine synthase subunit PurQ / glutaminase